MAWLTGGTAVVLLVTACDRPGGAGLPRNRAAASAPVLLQSSDWIVAPGPGKAVLQRLKEGYLLSHLRAMNCPSYNRRAP